MEENFDSLESVEEIKNIIQSPTNKDFQSLNPPFLKDTATIFDPLTKEMLNFSNISNIKNENEDSKKNDEKIIQINEQNKESFEIKLNRDLVHKNTRNCDKKNYFYNNENINSVNSYNINKNKIPNTFSFRNGKIVDRANKINLRKKKMNLLNDFLEYKCNSSNKNNNFVNRLSKIKQFASQLIGNNSISKLIPKKNTTLFNSNDNIKNKSEIFGVNDINNFDKKKYLILENNLNLDLYKNNNILFKKSDKKLKNEKSLDIFNNLNNKDKDKRFSNLFLGNKNNLSLSISNINYFDFKKFGKINSIINKSEVRPKIDNFKIFPYNQSYHKNKLKYNSCRQKIISDFLSNNKKLNLNNGNNKYSSFKYKKFCVLKSYESDIKERNDFSHIKTGSVQKTSRYYSRRNLEFRSINNKRLISY